MILGITGHRPPKVGGYKEDSDMTYSIKAALYTAIREHSPTMLITGMALGVDMWAAEMAIELNIPFIAALPFVHHDQMWPEVAQQRCRHILEKAYSIYTISLGAYTPWKMQIRNEWIVLNSEKLIAVWDGSDGGTANCVRFAEKHGTLIQRIQPMDCLLAHRVRMSQAT